MIIFFPNTFFVVVALNFGAMSQLLQGLLWFGEKTILLGRCRNSYKVFSDLVRKQYSKQQTMDPSPENNRAAWYKGPMKLEVVKSCGATHVVSVTIMTNPSDICLFVSTFWDQILNWNPICRDNFDNLDDNAIYLVFHQLGKRREITSFLTLLF